MEVVAETKAELKGRESKCYNDILSEIKGTECRVFP